MNPGGIGIDIVDVDRLEALIQKYGRKFLDRVFTEKETAYALSKKAASTHFAGRFAAKEAVKKALPEGYEKSVGWKDIEILNSEEGAPVVVLHGKAKKILTAAGISGVRVSISHTRKMAAANSVVV